MRTTALFLFMCLSAISAGQVTGLPEHMVGKGSVIIKAGTGYGFTEGSSVAPDGKVYFTDQPNDRIHVWDEKDGIRLFKEGTDRANGTYFDAEGNLIACADQHNSLIWITRSGQKVVLFDKGYEGNHFNGPNDLWIDKNGGIYFTDPYYHRPWWEQGHSQLLEVQGVYYLSSSGELVRVIDDLMQPNGIVGTPDGKYLYVADIKAGTTWRYDIGTNGHLSNKTRFAAAGSDGIALDDAGNVYLTSGKVLIYNPKGEKAGEIELPESPSNLCFGGKKRNILFITARTSVYTLEMKVKGVE
jgi:gluconolactonase